MQDHTRKIERIAAMPETAIHAIARKIAERGDADYPKSSFREVFGQQAHDLASAGWHGRFGPIMRQHGYEILLEIFPDGSPGCKVRKCA